MKNRNILIVLVSYLFLLNTSSKAAGPVYISPSHPYITYIGRVSFANPESPCFTYPGVQIRTIFEGTSLAMKVKSNSGYFMVEIDDQEAFKVGATENDSILVLAQNLSGGEHEIRIMLAYEGYQRRPEFRGFILDEGMTLPSAPVLPERKMEFIGNSITCGYGTEETDPTAPFKDETENHYYTYAAATARAFNAQNMIVARSGIGIYRNYNGPEKGSPDCMPTMYEQTLFKDSTEKWDFSRYSPDVVCINLGTNDTSTQPYDIQLLENGYRNFVQTVRHNYPESKIVLLTGSMLNGKALQDVKKALNNVMNEARKNGDMQIYRFDLSPQDGSLGYGASYHPSKAQQYKGAKELIPFIEEITGWRF